MPKVLAKLLFLLLFLPRLSHAQVGLPQNVTPSLPTPAELNESWARVLLRVNPGPFQYCAYEVTARGNAGVASHVRGVMGRKDAETRTELLARPNLAQFMGKLRDLGILELPHPPLPWTEPQAEKPHAEKAKNLSKRAKEKAKIEAQSPLTAPEPLWTPDNFARPVYELSFRLAGKENTFLVADPAGQSDPRYAEFIRLVREFAIKSAGEIGYHAPTGDEGREGYLFVDSVPGAIVTVDGAPLEGETPILAYPTSPGRHTLVLENKLHQLRKEIKVVVQPGLITSVELDLR